MQLLNSMFLGFNSTMREGNVTHHEYMQVGKGRDVGMNQISSFEAKVANGNGEQTLSRDIYRLGRRFDFYRMLSFYFTTVGFYFSSMVRILVEDIYVKLSLKNAQVTSFFLVGYVGENRTENSNKTKIVENYLQK